MVGYLLPYERKCQMPRGGGEGDEWEMGGLGIDTEPLEFIKGLMWLEKDAK